MIKLNNFLKNNNIKPLRYLKKGNIYILEENNNKFVIKENKNNDLLYSYLNSRSFDYFPKILKEDKDYILMEYIEENNIPKEQKIIDLIDLVTLLHSKTTLYKETTKDDFKKIYEDIKGNINYLKQYYDDIMRLIESKVYYSPSEYLLARNISIVYKSLSFCEIKIEEWYKLIENNTKQRYVLLHNNLDLNHFIESDKHYLISWDKSRLDLPIFDLYKLYKNNESFDFSETLKRYEHEYKLLDYEKELLFILISLPDKIEFNDSNINMCVKISNMINILDRARELTSPNNLEKTKNN